MREIFALGGVFLKTTLFHFQEKREVQNRFPNFIPYSRAFKKAYRFSNPFHICKEFLQKKNAPIVDAYGETPLPVLARIVTQCALSEKDHLIEMGCGRGKGVFFFSHLTGCSATGIDWVPTFIEKARTIAQSVKPTLSVEFRCQDMMDVDLSTATCIYLYGTCYEDEVIEALASRFATLNSSVKIVTVSYPLSEYHSKFYTETQWTGSFPWGEGEIYLNRLK